MKEVITSPTKQRDLAHRLAMAGWVARDILPHEPRLRAWLYRAGVSSYDIDDLIQEAYCRIATLDSIDHIEVPHAYFFSITKHLLFKRLKQQRIVPLETIAEIDALSYSTLSSLEEQIARKLAYDKVLMFMTELPERCRRVFELRKIRGWSQKEIAAHLGITEKAVEKQVWLAVGKIRSMWARAEHRPELLRKQSGQAAGKRR